MNDIATAQVGTGARIRELLEEAARSLDGQIDPFAHDFLVEHEVTLDEVGAMADNMALALRAWLVLLEGRGERDTYSRFVIDETTCNAVIGEAVARTVRAGGPR